MFLIAFKYQMSNTIVYEYYYVRFCAWKIQMGTEISHIHYILQFIIRFMYNIINVEMINLQAISILVIITCIIYQKIQ